jgi:hypothetical protein
MNSYEILFFIQKPLQKQNLKLSLQSQIKGKYIWPVRLGVRTSGFHPGNRGSIPLRATVKSMETPLSIADLGVFVFGCCNITETIWSFTPIGFRLFSDAWSHDMTYKLRLAI